MNLVPARVRSLFAAKRLRTPDVVEATVRPWEEQRRYYTRQPYTELLTRYSRYVKVAASRTATAVASAKLRVYRSTEGQKSAWDRRPASKDWRAWAKSTGGVGHEARKALDMAGNDEVEEITDPMHPLVSLLDRANGRDNGYDLLEDTQLGLGLLGNAYWAMVSDGGIPTELWPLPPQWVEVLPDRGSPSLVRGYRYGRGYDIETEYPAEDVIHFRQRNPHDPYYGLSDLAACLVDADLSNLFTEAAIAMLKNGAHPGLVVTMEDGSEQQAKAVEAKINSKHRGAWSWFRTMVLWGKTKLEPLELSEGATKFLAAPADKVREVIANCFDMPVSALTQDASSLAATNSQDTRWKRTGILPRLRRIEDQINAVLVPKFAGQQTGRIFVAFDNPVEVDETEVTARVVQLFTGDIITLNEARAELKYDALPDGDQRKTELAPPMMDPFGGANANGSPARNGGGGDAVPPRNGGSGGGDGGDKSLLDTDHPRVHAPAREDVRPGREVDGDKPARHRKGADSGGAPRTDTALILYGDTRTCCTPRKGKNYAIKDDRGLEEAVRAWLLRAGNIIADALERGQPVESVRDQLARTFQEATGQPIESVFGEGFDAGVEAVLRARPSLADSATTFATRPQGAIDFLSQYQIRLSNSVIGTVTTRVNELLAAGIQQGQSIPEMTTALTAEFEGLSGYAAERIARTESSRAFGMGRIAGWRELPGVTKKRWLLSSAPCPMCLDLASRREVVGVNEPFARIGEVFGGVVIAYADVYTNTLHPNDSCGMTFVFEDEDEQ